MSTTQVAQQHNLVRDLRGAVLTWVGIIGTALTIFSKVHALFQVADWARWVVSKWDQWTHAFWTTLAQFAGIQLDPGLVPVLSFLLFAILTAAGAAIRGSPTADLGRSDAPVLVLTRIAHLVVAITMVLLALVPLGVAAIVSILLDVQGEMGAIRSPPAVLLYAFDVLSPGTWAYNAVIWCLPGLLLLLVSRNWATLVSAIVLLLMFFLITVIPLEAIRNALGLQAISGLPVNESMRTEIRSFNFDGALFWLSIIFILAVAPIKALARKLVFIVGGIGALIGLNELSKLGLGSYLKPPRL